MTSSKKVVRNMFGEEISLSKLQSLRVLRVSLPMAELLNSVIAAPVHTKEENKLRKKRNKTSQRMCRRRRAHEIQEDAIVQPVFVPNSNKPWETGKTLTEFFLFNKLAPEIRQMVWLEVFPNAQAIKITDDGYNCKVNLTLVGIRHYYTYRAKAIYVPSPLLFVNRESRDMVTSRYPLAFATQLGGRPIRFNFKKDILYFENPSALINFYGGCLPHFELELQTYGYKYDMSEVHDKVHNVAVGNITLYKGVVGGTLNQFKALKTVILGGALGEDVGQPYDMIADFITGDNRLTFGWERFQNFKTAADGNMPVIERLRKDRFDKAIKDDYTQYTGPEKHGPAPNMKPTKVKIPPIRRLIDAPEYNDGVDTDMLDAEEENQQQLVLRQKRMRAIGIRVNC